MKRKKRGRHLPSPETGGEENCYNGKGYVRPPGKKPQTERERNEGRKNLTCEKREGGFLADVFVELDGGPRVLTKKRRGGHVKKSLKIEKRGRDFASMTKKEGKGLRASKQK